MLRKAFIVLALLLFVAYCVGAYRHQYRVAVPDYVVGEVDLLKGFAAKKWDDKNFQTTHLSNLAAHCYQATSAGLTLPDGTKLAPGTVLKQPEFGAIIADARKNLRPARVVVADPARIMALQDKRYVFRDPVKAADGSYLFRGGEAIDQAAVDKLLAAGLAGRLVGVEGSPSPVAVELGTLLSVLVIFLCLVAAMKGTLVDPLLRIVETRSREIDAGSDLAKKNTLATEQFQKDRALQLAQLARSRHMKLQEGRHAALKEGEAILHHAKEEERRLRYDALQKLNEAVEEARHAALAEAGELGRQAVRQVLGRDI